MTTTRVPKQRQRIQK